MDPFDRPSSPTKLDEASALFLDDLGDNTEPPMTDASMAQLAREDVPESVTIDQDVTPQMPPELRDELAGIQAITDDLAGIQVRISPVGMPFTPGHTAGVDVHGHLSASGSQSAAHAHSHARGAAWHAAQALSGVAGGTGNAGSAEAVEHYASQAAFHAGQAAHHAGLVPTHTGARTAAAEAAKHAGAARGAAADHHVAAAARAAYNAAGHANEAERSTTTAHGASLFAASAAEAAAKAEHHAGKAYDYGSGAANHAAAAAEHAARAEAAHNTKKAAEDRTRANVAMAHHMAEANHGAAEAQHHADRAQHHLDQALIAPTKAQAEHHATQAEHHLAQAQASLAMTATHSMKIIEAGGDASGHMSSAADSVRVANVAATRARRMADRFDSSVNAPVRPTLTTPTSVADDGASKFFGKRRGVDLNHLAESFSAPGHFKAELDHHSYNPHDKKLHVSYSLRDASGQRVGSLSRNFRKDDKGRISVYHADFQLNDSAQGSGAAKKMFASAVMMYKKAGVKEITVSAGLDKGRYVWASFGFQAPAHEVERFKSSFVNHLNTAAQEHERAASAAAAGNPRNQITKVEKAKAVKLRAAAVAATTKIKTMQHIADFKHGGVKFGKDWLLNVGNSMPMWHGKITLSASDPGYRRLRKKIGLDSRAKAT